MRWITTAWIACLCSVAAAQTTQPSVVATSRAESVLPTSAPADPSVVMDLKLRRPHEAPKPGQVLEMRIEQLGNFTYDPLTPGGIPADVRSLDGCTLRVHGYILPVDQVEDITEFMLVPRLLPDQPGVGTLVQHSIIVHAPPGKPIAKYTTQELIVEGTLKVAETEDDGYIVSIFDITATSVRAAK